MKEEVPRIIAHKPRFAIFKNRRLIGHLSSNLMFFRNFCSKLDPKASFMCKFILESEVETLVNIRMFNLHHQT